MTWQWKQASATKIIHLLFYLLVLSPEIDLNCSCFFLFSARYNDKLMRWDENGRRNLDFERYGLKFDPVTSADSGTYLCLINNRREPDSPMVLTVQGTYVRRMLPGWIARSIIGAVQALSRFGPFTNIPIGRLLDVDVICYSLPFLSVLRPSVCRPVSLATQWS